MHRASSLLGLTVPKTLNAGNVGRLNNDVRTAVVDKREAAGELVAALRDRTTRYGAVVEGRVRTAESAQSLLAALHVAADEDLVRILACSTLDTSEAAVARSMAQARSVVDALEATKWDLIDAMRNLHDHRETAALSIIRRLTEALGSEEHVIPLKLKLLELDRDAVRLLTATAPAPTATSTSATAEPADPATPGLVPPPLSSAHVNGASGSAIPAQPSRIFVDQAEEIDLGSAQAASVLQALQDRLQGDHELELSLSWRLQRRSKQP